VYACLNVLRHKHPLVKEMSNSRLKRLISDVKEYVGTSKSVSIVLDGLIKLGYIKSYSKEKSRL
jgi:hypothetical protein